MSFIRLEKENIYPLVLTLPAANGRKPPGAGQMLPPPIGGALRGVVVTLIPPTFWVLLVCITW
jgi:hypothetical protein